MPELWPFPIHGPAGEVLEWRTDVLISRAGEQRIALRPVPRQIVTYRHLLDGQGLARTAELARAGFRAEWLVPLWAMAAPVATDLAETDLTVPVDTGTADWRAPGHAALAEDGGEAVIVEVGAVHTDRLELAAPVGVSLRNPIIAPARRAILTAPVALERRRRSLGVVTAIFTLADGVDLGASALPTHLGLDVLTDPAVLRQPLGEAVSQTVEYVDNGFGPIAIEPVRAYLQRRSTITTVDHGPAAAWTRRRWLWSLRGRQRPFWLPSWGRELVLQASVAAGDTSIVVAPIAGLEAYAGRHVMIELADGFLFREVTSASADPLGHRLALAAPGVALPQSTPVHWLTKVRLDADRIELGHLATRTEVTVPVIEVPA